MGYENFFIALTILGNYLGKTTRNKSTLPAVTYVNNSLVYYHQPVKSLSLHDEQVNRVKNEVDGKPSSILVCIEVSHWIIKQLLLLCI